MASHIPIQSAIRKGCLLSMALYTLSLQPLLRTLKQRLAGVKLGRGRKRISVIAYADDITVFLTRQEDIEIERQAIDTYKRATGAQLNPRKSKALTLGGWSTSLVMMGIEEHINAKILGVTFGRTTEETANESWTRTINMVRAQAQMAYNRNLCLVQRIQYVQTYLLAKIWYLAQIIPPTKRHTQQLTTICTWFIWKGTTFRVPLTTLQRPLSQGGWNVPNIALKCQALLLGRMWKMIRQKESAPATLLQSWNVTDRVDNPPHIHGIPRQLTHVYQYALNMAYVAQHTVDTPLRKMRQQTYRTLHTLTGAKERETETRILRKHPETNWRRLWNNLHSAWITDTQKSIWYMVIHDIIPTKERLAAINLAETDKCATCGATDNIQHRLTTCGECRIIWNWTRARRAAFTCTETKYIPETWTSRPDFQIWPPQRHRATLWILAHFVDYIMQTHQRISLLDYVDFMRQAQWKAGTSPARRRAVGNYLDVL
jgi:hypothetical protein